MPPRIEHYAFGTVTVDGQVYTSDVIVLPDRVIPNWWRKSGHSLVADDLQSIAEGAVRILVVGTGSPGMMKVPGRTIRALGERGIEAVVEPTDRAVETYNRLAPRGGVAACLHLTC